ncbi:MAG: VWA domain-containing protein [Thermoanaerobaculia bacterium]
MRKLLLTLVLVTLTFPAFAQEPFRQSVEVTVVNVDVVVTDRDGNPVHGLNGNDFELLEDGVRQKLTNFTELRGDAGNQQPSGVSATGDETSSRPTRFVFFVDSWSMHPIARREILAGIDRFIDSQMRPGDLASVVDWNGTYRIEQPLTEDRAALHAAVARISSQSSPAVLQSGFDSVRKACTAALAQVRSGQMAVLSAYHECISFARVDTDRTVLISKSLVNALDVTIATVGGADGKKVLVVAGALLPKDPGLETYQWANQLFMPWMRGFDAPNERPNPEQVRKHRERIESLGRNANTHGVTMYMIAAGAPANSMDITSADALADAGGDFLRLGNTEDAYQDVADATGGIAMKRASRFDRALETVRRDVDSYYSLGFRPSRTNPNDRNIEVKVRRKGVVARVRRSWAPLSEQAQTRDRVIANVFAPAEPSAWKIGVRTGKPQPQGDQYQVPLEITIPSSIELVKRGDAVEGGFTVWVAVGNDQGALSTVFHQANPVRIQPAEEKDFRSQPLVFTANLTVREGRNLLSVGITDAVTKETSFARGEIVAEK